MPFKVVEPEPEIKKEASEEVKESEPAEVSAFAEEKSEVVEEEKKEESKTKREKFDVRMSIKSACVSVQQ